MCLSYMRAFMKNVMATIRAKSSVVLLGAIFLGLMYVIYSRIISPIRLNRIGTSVSLEDAYNTAEGLFDMRLPIKEAFGTEYDSCINIGYDAQFCLRSQNSRKRPEDIPI